MKTKNGFNGKAIYNPSGKAGEYSKWACNFYVGCSNGCTYCYLKKSILAHAMGGDKPKLKACFKDVHHAYSTFIKEAEQNIIELREHGLFFTFTSDAFLPETKDLTLWVMNWCQNNKISVKILTKKTDWLRGFLASSLPLDRKYYAFGFTLTGHDELEPNASSNRERIEAMKRLHERGFKTFASIEPIIDFENSYEMIMRTKSFCDLYKIGLESGKKYSKKEQDDFIFKVICLSTANNLKVYFKESILNSSSYSREILPIECVTRDYNLFK